VWAERTVVAILTFKDEAQTALFKDPSPYRAVKTFHLGYTNQSVYAVSGTSSQINTKHINTVWAERTVVAILTFKDEELTALFKDPVRTAL